MVPQLGALNVAPLELPPFPLTGEKVVLFISRLTRDKLQYDTVVKYANTVVIEAKLRNRALSVRDQELVRRAKLAAEKILGRQGPRRAVTLSRDELKSQLERFREIRSANTIGGGLSA